MEESIYYQASASEFTERLLGDGPIELGIGLQANLFYEIVRCAQGEGRVIKLHVWSDTDMRLHLVMTAEAETDDSMRERKTIPPERIMRVYAMIKRELMRLIDINDRLDELVPRSCDSGDPRSNETMSRLDGVLYDLRELADYRLRSEYLRALREVDGQ